MIHSRCEELKWLPLPSNPFSFPIERAPYALCNYAKLQYKEVLNIISEDSNYKYLLVGLFAMFLQLYFLRSEGPSRLLLSCVFLLSEVLVFLFVMFTFWLDWAATAWAAVRGLPGNRAGPVAACHCLDDSITPVVFPRGHWLHTSCGIPFSLCWGPCRDIKEQYCFWLPGFLYWFSDIFDRHVYQ